METQIGSCLRQSQSASLLLLRISHMLITAQSNGGKLSHEFEI